MTQLHLCVRPANSADLLLILLSVDSLPSVFRLLVRVPSGWRNIKIISRRGGCAESASAAAAADEPFVHRDTSVCVRCERTGATAVGTRTLDTLRARSTTSHYPGAVPDIVSQGRNDKLTSR
ncbi:hypothetical protein QTP88_011918 [Uroleucon formosanum]